MDLIQGQINFLGEARHPHLEIYDISGETRKIPFTCVEAGHKTKKTHWLAQPDLPAAGDWKFRLNLGNGAYYVPKGSDYFSTRLQTLWVQDYQIFSYQPAPVVSPSRVVKIPDFTGSMPTRALYIYLPRGYDEHQDQRYPVIYMHDGQNCFEAFVKDSFSGSWQADKVADRLISQGQMHECIIVGVSNGREKRETEYLPPYTVIYPPSSAKSTIKNRKIFNFLRRPITGRADQTLAYYRNEVAPYIYRHYRALAGRDNTATCGSSLGGLFTTYIAWEQTGFARHHAALSPSFWITRTPQDTLEIIERLRTGEPRDIRFWLDSGTLDSPHNGDDGRYDTLAAYEALLENDYVIGPDFQYYLAEGAIHHESAWAARLDKVFRFLFPVEIDHA